MGAQVLTIVGRRRRWPLKMAAMRDFRCRDAGGVDAGIVLDRPNISLYCLDHAERRAIFVETDPGVSLSGAPFLYQAQFEMARRLVAVPYDTLHGLAAVAPFDPSRLILVYSISRCGSTLVSRALAEGHRVRSLSEPDVFTQLLLMRRADGSNTPEIRELLHACTRILCARDAQSAEPFTIALKFRSVVIELSDLFEALFPEAKVIFLYRHAEAWAESFARAFRVLRPGMRLLMPFGQRYIARFLPHVAARIAASGTMSPVELLACLWVGFLEHARALQARGVPMLPVAYEVLTEAPEEVMHQVFAYCGIPAGDRARLGRVLAADAQEGTLISRRQVRDGKRQLTDTDIAALHRAIGAYSRGLTADFVLPNTLQIGAREPLTGVL